MFDWDEVPEDLGAPDETAAPRVEVLQGAEGSELLRAVRKADLPPLLDLLEERGDPNAAPTGQSLLFEALASSLDVVAALLLFRADPQQRSDGALAADHADASTRTLLRLWTGDAVAAQARRQLLGELGSFVRTAVITEIDRRAPAAVARHGAVGDAGSVPAEAAGLVDATSSAADLAPLPVVSASALVTLDAAEPSLVDAALAYDAELAPLALAAACGDLPETRRLLDAAADPNARDGPAPLFEALSAGHVDVVATLLLRRADPWTVTTTGMLTSELAWNPVTRNLLEAFRGVEIDADAKVQMVTALSPEMREPMGRHLQALAMASAVERMRRRARGR